MLLFLNGILMAFQFAAWEVSSNTHTCVLNCSNQRQIYKAGDLMIGGIMQRSWFNVEVMSTDAWFRKQWLCDFIPVHSLQYHIAFIYASHQINKNRELLSNRTLGYKIFDSCSNIIKALHGTLSILSEQTDPVPNYSCQKQTSVVGIIGDLISSTTKAIAHILQLYKYPQVNFSALDPVFRDKIRFPSFYRNFPHERCFFTGITQLLRYFSWMWVGILAIEDDTGERAVQQIKKAVAQSGGCIEFLYTLPTELSKPLYRKLAAALENIQRSTTQVIILYNSGSPIQHFFLFFKKWQRLPGKIWISSPGMGFPIDTVMNIFNGSLQFSIKKRQINGLQDFLYDLVSSKFQYDKGLAFDLVDIFKCTRIDHNHDNESLNASLPLCSSNNTMQRLSLYTSELSSSRLTYSVYTAVYVLAHALHNMLSSDNTKGNASAYWNINRDLEPWKLNRFLQKTHFRTPDGDEIVFDNTGGVTDKFDILNWVIFRNGTIMCKLVGNFDSSAPEGKQLVINQSAILWNSEGPNAQQTPRSICSESCLPGYRKVPIEQKPICCFHCVSCAEGEFSNSTDMDSCLRCPDSHWPHERKDSCIPRTVDFLSYSDYLGLNLASAAILFFLSTSAVLSIFIHHWDTPIVKANNRNLSYTLLVSLMLSFLCSLLFIGQPGTLTCLIQQAAFGIIFTVAVSCILTKTIIVVIAFNATKPGSKLSRWLGSSMAASMVTVCTLGEVVICLSWQLTSPPHPDTDIVSETGKMILQCNQGSVTAFYVMIGYMGGLAFASFIVAFLAKNLPDRFNEAQLITFSMLVFCSVWLSFIPAYLSAKGRYMVAVEVFAILASSAGLLGCIFIPKCFIILFRPALNRREHAALKIKLDDTNKNTV